jgi:ABC-2 type transport system permease protein
MKLASSLVLGMLSVAAVYAAADATGKPAMPVGAWIATGVIAWLGSLTFAALGLFIGYLLPTENVMQVIGFFIMLCSFARACSSHSASFPIPYAS